MALSVLGFSNACGLITVSVMILFLSFTIIGLVSETSKIGLREATGIIKLF